MEAIHRRNGLHSPVSAYCVDSDADQHSPIVGRHPPSRGYCLWVLHDVETAMSNIQTAKSRPPTFGYSYAASDAVVRARARSEGREPSTADFRRADEKLINGLREASFAYAREILRRKPPVRKIQRWRLAVGIAALIVVAVGSTFWL